MVDASRRLISDFQVRKSEKQKRAFREWLCSVLESEGYSPVVESSWCGSNVVVGNPDDPNTVLVTAHYDTCAWLPFPNFSTPRCRLWPMLMYFGLGVVLGFIGLGFSLVLSCIPFAPSWFYSIAEIGFVLFFFWWLVDGPANRHTMNDNTSGVLTLLELALALPVEQRGKVCFVFFDNEEKGLWGSRFFKRKHEGVGVNNLMLNVDCVSDGDHFHFLPNASFEGVEKLTMVVLKSFPADDTKTVEVAKGKLASDQKGFRRGVGICALKHSRVLGYYLHRIHTHRDTVLDEWNIEYLRDGLLCLLEMLAKFP